jgi:hypothetical protein
MLLLISLSSWQVFSLPLRSQTSSKLCYSFTVRYQVSHWYKTTDKIRGTCFRILIHKVLDRDKKPTVFWLNSRKHSSSYELVMELHWTYKSSALAVQRRASASVASFPGPNGTDAKYLYCILRIRRSLRWSNQGERNGRRIGVGYKFIQNFS